MLLIVIININIVFADFKNNTCCCDGSTNYSGVFCVDIELEDKIKSCSENVIIDFVSGFSNSSNLCDFCKKDTAKLKLNSAICSGLAKSTNSKYKDEINDVYNFLNDFIKSGSCDSVCDCIDPKAAPSIGSCEECVCVRDIVGDGIDGPVAMVKEGCTSLQFFSDWTKLTTQKCTTKKFN